MAKAWKAPGSCADCGNDAYIRVPTTDGSSEMLCAHCYADRHRDAAAPPERVTLRPIGRPRPQ